MEFDTSETFYDFSTQRDTLISGQFNTLFNNLNFNIPFRFLSYARPDSLDNLLKQMHKDINDINIKIHKQDAYPFNKIIKLFKLSEEFYDTSKALNYLVNICKITEKHIYLKKENSEYQLYPTEQIYLSRYAMCLITKNLLKESKSFKHDVSAPLFISEENKLNKNDFEREMLLAFTSYYFSYPNDTDYEELSEITWMWVRGKRLKLSYDSAIKKLRYVAQGVYKKEFSHHKFEEFKQKFIFDILFKQTWGNTSFKTQYEKTLEKFGYALGSYKDDEDVIKWHKGHKTAPKYPGGFFAPQITFLLTWSINMFCEFEKQEFNYKTKNKINWFENLSEKFFSSIREGMLVEKYKYNKTDYDFNCSEIFVNQHHSEAYKIINNIKNGSGKTKTDKQSGEKIHDNPSALEFWKNYHLFSEDDNLCLNIRKNMEAKLNQLHNAYKENPAPEIAKQIIDSEKIIRDETLAIYGVNFQAFVDVPETLVQTGNFIPRQIFGPTRILTNIHMQNKSENKIYEKEKTDIQYKIDFENPINQIQKEFNINYLGVKKFSGFTIVPDNEIIVPRGHPVKRTSFLNKNNELIECFKLDKNGIYETINPLLKKPTEFNKENLPKLVRENFERCNFLFESDTLPLTDQIDLAKSLVSLNVINRVVFSGKKSYHMVITVKDAPKTSEEYKWLFFYLGTQFGLVSKQWNENRLSYKYNGVIDLSICNNNHSMRRAGAIRILEDGKKVEQNLIHQTNTVYDIEWRSIYEQEIEKIKALQKYISSTQTVTYKNTNIKTFMENYSNKNYTPLTFDSGNGHNTGCILIGAAKTAGFSDNDITNWLKENCDRYNELINGWRGLLKSPYIRN